MKLVSHYMKEEELGFKKYDGKCFYVLFICICIYKIMCHIVPGSLKEGKKITVVVERRK